MTNKSQTTERDTWLTILRSTAAFCEKAFKADGDVPMSFIVFGSEGEILCFSVDFADDTHKMKVLEFIAMVGIAADAKGVAISGQTAMLFLDQREGEDDDSYRNRALAAGLEGKANWVRGIAATVVYRDDQGARKVISQSSVVTKDGNGALTFGKPDMSAVDATLFGGLVEVMREERPGAAAQREAAAWLMLNAATTMRRLGIFSVNMEGDAA